MCTNRPTWRRSTDSLSVVPVARTDLKLGQINAAADSVFSCASAVGTSIQQPLGFHVAEAILSPR